MLAATDDHRHSDRRSWVIDLDGVVWHGAIPIPGAARALEGLRSRGDRVIFATNHSTPTRAELLAQLRSCGVPATADEIRSSADAAATLVDPGERVLAFAGSGVREAADRRGAALVDHGPADAVIVGWHDDLSFEGLSRAVRCVLDGARLIGTNDDRLRPTPDGLVPGAGAFLAAVELSTSTRATRAGKPYEPMARLLRPMLDGDVIVVGDSVATDGALASLLRARFALVLCGVTNEPPRTFDGDLVARDLAAVVEHWDQR
jgi:HAD superfamily hydrolase (TIGR01450 family)